MNKAKIKMVSLAVRYVDKIVCCRTCMINDDEVLYLLSNRTGEKGPRSQTHGLMHVS